MSNYTKLVDYAAKDLLLHGDPAKAIKGTEVGAEFDAIATMSATKVDSGGALGTPTSGTLTNCTGLPLAGVVDSTTEPLGVGSLEVGHASDTTISRASAGTIAVEGVNILTTATGAALAGSASQTFNVAAATENDHAVSRTFGDGRYVRHGQCYLSKSGANLILTPRNGNRLIINGNLETIPSAGVTLAAPATTNTTYYIYAYMNGATMTLEYSATGHATDSATGVEIKSGDATRTLVGMARTVSSAWVDTEVQRFVISWFNRRRKSLLAVVPTNRTTTSGSFVEMSASDRVEFLTWSDEAVNLTAAGSVGGVTGTTDYLAVGLDASAAGAVASTTYGTYVSMTASWNGLISEGYHYSSTWGAISSTTFTLYANYSQVTGSVMG